MTIKAHFDGKVIVPDEPLDLPVNQKLRLEVVAEPTPTPVAGENGVGRPLMDLLKVLDGLPSNPDAPVDGAAQHDHYLYGLPKRP
jgi:hypothetical protein